jgi:TldD protein
MTGVFAHEAFRPFSEADIIEDNSSLRAKMALGAELGSEAVNIVADSTLPGQVGFYRSMTKGFPVRRVQLMRRGVSTGRLHSLRTAGEFGEGVTGHAVAEDYRYEPIVRMGTIFFEPGQNSFDGLLSRLGDGLLLCDAKGGQTAGENFTFGAQYGYKVKGGKKGPMVRDINIMGNLFSTLRSIEAAADDFQINERGGCGKGQMNIKSGHGAPLSSSWAWLWGVCDMEKLLDLARKAGCEAEVYGTNPGPWKLSRREGRVVETSASLQSGVALRIIADGRLGTAYTEEFSTTGSL